MIQFFSMNVLLH